MIIPSLSHVVPIKLIFPELPIIPKICKKKTRHRQLFGGPSRGAPQMRCSRTSPGKSMGNSPVSIQNRWVSHGFPRFFLAMVNLVGSIWKLQDFVDLALDEVGWCIPDLKDNDRSWSAFLDIFWVQKYSLVLWSMSSHSNWSEKVYQRVCLGKRISTPPTTCIAETSVVYWEFPKLGTNKHGWSNAYVNPNALNSSILFIYIYII